MLFKCVFFHVVQPLFYPFFDYISGYIFIEHLLCDRHSPRHAGLEADRDTGQKRMVQWGSSDKG